jgi:uncharacterized protein YndB with AHSA1/START domain
MNNPDQVYTTYIKTTPEKLWDAITNPEFARQYWGGNVNVSDWKKGSKWRHENGGNKELYVTGDILESVRPKRLVLTWAGPEDLADVSHVTFEIEQMTDVVRLVVTHGQFKAGSTMPGKVSKGWPLVLSSLKSFLETGKPIDIVLVKGPCGTTEGKVAAA